MYAYNANFSILEAFFFPVNSGKNGDKRKKIKTFCQINGL